MQNNELRSLRMKLELTRLLQQTEQRSKHKSSLNFEILQKIAVESFEILRRTIGMTIWKRALSSPSPKTQPIY